MKKNWKTTLLGMLTLAAQLFIAVQNGKNVDINTRLQNIAGVAAGFGLLAAKDAESSDSDN